MGTDQAKPKGVLRHRALSAPWMHPSFLFPLSPPVPSRVVSTAHAQGSEDGHRMSPDTPWGSRDVTHPSCHHPGQTHARHIWRLLPHCSLQMKVSKPPAPQENPQRLCKAGLALLGQTHSIQASQKGTPVLPSLSTGVAAQLPLLMAMGTGLRLLPGCKTPAWL